MSEEFHDPGLASLRVIGSTATVPTKEADYLGCGQMADDRPRPAASAPLSRTGTVRFFATELPLAT